MRAKIPQDFRRGYHYIGTLDAASLAFVGGGCFLGLSLVIHHPTAAHALEAAISAGLGLAFGLLNLPPWEEGGERIWTWTGRALSFIQRNRKGSAFEVRRLSAEGGDGDGKGEIGGARAVHGRSGDREGCLGPLVGRLFGGARSPR